MKRIFLIIMLVMAAVNVFGLNKIRWKQMDWHIYETEHFYIYYYEGEEFLAKLACVNAEDAYAANSGQLHFESKSKIPLFIYEDGLDFSSTNITLSYLGEGVGGFTESFKNRVALPASGSLKGFRQVITHEITHAIQYNVIFGEGIRSYNTLYKDLFVPTWVMEGLAEYCADDKTTEGEMVLRDAVINERLIKMSDLEGFGHLNEPYLAYKEAQNIFEYIANKYGKDKPAQFLHYYGNEMGTLGVFKKILNKDPADFEKEWSFFLKKKYWAQVQGRENPDKYGPRLTESSHNNPVYNQAPEFSPDGNNMAFISTSAGHGAIYIMRQDGKEIRQVFSGYDGISGEGFPLCWSYDGKELYFAAKDKGRRYIFRGNVENGSAQKLEIPGMTNVYSPAISPDSRFLAFVGAEAGFSDVYIHDMTAGSTVNITGNIYENNFVSWSAGGNSLVFTEEREEFRRIAVYDLKTGTKKFITGQEKHDYSFPRFTGDNEILYTSDKNGIFNLYKMNLETGAETRLTNIVSGVFYPSVSAEYYAYSCYEDAGYNIYKYLINPSAVKAEIPLVYMEGVETPQPTPLPQATRVKAPETKLMPDKYAVGDDESYKKFISGEADKRIKSTSLYSTSFTPDLVLGLLGFSSDSGFVGGGYLTLSDMLGNHNFALLANIVPGYYAQFDLTYLYMSLPFDVGLRVFYYQDIYELYEVSTGEFFSQLDSTEIGGSMSLKYPFNAFTSVSVDFKTSRVADKYTNYQTSSTYLFPENSVNILNTLALYFEYDYSAWRDMWPYAGQYVLAYVETADKMFGGTSEYTMYQADIRKYFDMSFVSDKNMTLSLRGLFAMTTGKDRPFYLFGGRVTDHTKAMWWL
jgi:WD40 repeat protein